MSLGLGDPRTRGPPGLCPPLSNGSYAPVWVQKKLNPIHHILHHLILRDVYYNAAGEIILFPT